MSIIDTIDIERFTATKCIGYSADFVWTYYEHVLILKDGSTVTVYHRSNPENGNKEFMTERPVIDVPLPIGSERTRP